MPINIAEIMMLLAGAALAASIALGICLPRIKKLRSAAQDMITGGLAEAAFMAAAQKQLAKSSTPPAFVSVHIENLCDIGAAWGPEQNALVLCHVHSSISAHLGSDELLTRTGDDTFLFSLKNRKSDEICARLDKIYSACSLFSKSNGYEYRLKLRFGIYIPEPGESHVTTARNKASLARQNCPFGQRYCFYDGNTLEQSNRRMDLVSSMDEALKNNEFIVYLQPVVRLSDEKIAGAEALVRWRHPILGMLSPDMFLPLAEQYQKLQAIDTFVFGEVCRLLSRWKALGMEDCPISVNISKADLENSGFADERFAVCRQYGVSPSLIEFEIKEQLLLNDISHSASMVERLHAVGFRCAIDNYGADKVSLQLLGSIDIDTVKLDHSFFSGENNSRSGRHIVEALLKLTSSMHIRTVAEGIDHPSQITYLKQVACDRIQGFYYYKPMAADKFDSAAYDGKMLRYSAPHSSDNAETQKNRSTAAAAASENVILFSYVPQTDSIEFSEAFSPVLGGCKKFSDALALFRTTQLIHENDRDDFFKLLDRCQREDGWVENTLRLYTAEGRYSWLEIHMHQEKAESGSVVSGTMVNTALWNSEVNRWKEKATRDPLTGLYNRDYFEQNVDAQLKKASFESAALVFIDVDDFKNVNDTLGHMFGDEVLRFVAKQIQGIFRPADIVARYGGDEFVVFAPHVPASVLSDRLDRLCRAFSYPYRNNTIEYKVSGSIGAAVYPENGTDYETLLEHADCALYEAKSKGKDRFVLYEPYMQS